MTHIAHDYFALPDSDRLSLHYGDGGDVVEQLRHRGEKRYDAILVDAYDGRGAAESVSSPSFFDDCRSLLGDHGIAVFNLWATQKRFYSFCVRSIENCFEGKLLKLPVPQKGNVIALACKGELPVLKRKTLHSKALLLQSQMAIEYPGFLKQIQQNNGRNPLKRLLARL
jgi:spermidine synthase